MKFEDALNQVHDKIVEKYPVYKNKGIITQEGLEVAAIAWNMIALAQKEKGLDDFVIIDNNKSIKSISLTAKDNNKKDIAKSRGKKTAIDGIDVEKEKPQQPQ